MNKKLKIKLKDLLYRYSVLVLLAFFGISIFYFIFEPLTVYPSYFLFKIFYHPILQSGNIFYFPRNLISLQIIGSCVAGSAYLLLTILNISTPKIKLSKRLYLLGTAFLSFLVLNIIRIFLIGVLFIEKVAWANFAHEFFWYFGSIAFVIIIWFFQVKKSKIKEIPFYSDLKFVYKLINK